MRTFVFAASALVVVSLLAPVNGQEPPRDISWTRDFGGGLKAAQKSGKPVLLDFSATWCGPCQAMEREVWPERAVVERAQKFVCISVDVDNLQGMAARYRADSIPLIVLADPYGNQLSRHVGYMGTAELADWLEHFPSDFAPVVEGLAAADANPEDVDALVSVGAFYTKLGAGDVSRKFYERALNTDTLKNDVAKREEVLIAIGLSYLKTGDDGAARKTFERCVKECAGCPRQDFALLGLVTAQIKQGKRKDAERTLADLKAKYPDSPATAQALKNMEEGSKK